MVVPEEGPAHAVLKGAGAPLSLRARAETSETGSSHLYCFIISRSSYTSTNTMWPQRLQSDTKRHKNNEKNNKTL